VVGRILSGAGIPGFLDNLTKLYEAADTEGQRWRAVVEVWREAYDSQRVKAADIYKVVTEAGIDLELRGKSEKALQSAFGKALGKMKDRVIGEYQIHYAGTHKRIAEWRLMKTDGTDDLFGVGGVGGVGSDPQDTLAHAPLSRDKGQKPTPPTPTYTNNDDMPDDDQPDKSAEEQPHGTDDAQAAITQARNAAAAAIVTGDRWQEALADLAALSQGEHDDLCRKPRYAKRLAELRQQQEVQS
jgi:hypothetical protein